MIGGQGRFVPHLGGKDCSRETGVWSGLAGHSGASAGMGPAALSLTSGPVLNVQNCSRSGQLGAKTAFFLIVPHAMAICCERSALLHQGPIKSSPSPIHTAIRMANLAAGLQ